MVIKFSLVYIKNFLEKLFILFQSTMPLSRASDLNYYSFKNTHLPKQATDPKQISDIPPKSDQKIEEIYGVKVASLSNCEWVELSKAFSKPYFLNKEWCIKKRDIWYSERRSDVNQKLFSLDVDCKM